MALIFAVLLLFTTTSINLCCNLSYHWHKSPMTSSPQLPRRSLECEEHLDVHLLADPSGPSSLLRYPQYFNHFWESTGFCPPDPHQKACEWFHSEDMQRNLAIIAALPYTGIKQVRIHWLLNAVTLSSLEGGQPDYNLTCLTSFIHKLHINELRPGFELMGNPSNIFTDFENATQILWWKKLVTDVAQAFVDKYGMSEVATWNFETWNEPKKHKFDGMNITIQGFLNYYDACVEGLRAVDGALRLGGPGGELHEFSPSSFSWALLNHTAHGTNHMTLEKTKLLDFISIHKKGSIPSNTAVIMQKEKDFLSLLLEHLPSLRAIPIHNNEADPIVTWSRPYEFRADATYAAMVVKVIAAHLSAYPTPIENSSQTVQFQLLSNDNGFLSYKPNEFSQRTLMARFQINDTAHRQVHFIRKPVYSVMGLLSLLGDESVGTGIKAKGNCSSSSYNSLSVISTTHTPKEFSKRDSWQLASIASLSDDTNNSSRVINVTFHPEVPSHLPSVKWVIYCLDNNLGNPYKIWRQHGSPSAPSSQLMQLMSEQEEPMRMQGPSDLPAEGITISLQTPSVALLHVCAKGLSGPNQVESIQFFNVTRGQVMITWSDSSVQTKCIKTYEIEFSPFHPTAFNRINKKDTIFNSFVHYAPHLNSLQDPAAGYYRVVAVDYWNRRSNCATERYPQSN